MSDIRNCTDCGDPYAYDHKAKKGSTTNRCAGCAKRHAKEETKRMMLDAAGGGCKNCGYNKCLSAITFYDPVARLAPIPDPKNRDEKIEWAKARIPLCLNCSQEFENRMIHLLMKNVAARPVDCAFYTDVADIVETPHKKYQVGFPDPQAPKHVPVEVTKDEPSITREATRVDRAKADATGSSAAQVS
jgi:hypothetical protein